MKKLFILLPSFLLVIACNPKKEAVRGNFNRDAGGSIAGALAVTNSCPQGVSGIGTIFDDGQMTQVSLDSVSGNFETRVKALLSATTSSDEVGQISGLATDQTGVRFQGIVKLDAKGLVIGAQSKMLIKIYDSYVLNSQLDPNGTKYEPIAIEFIPTSGSQIQGQFNLQTGEGSVSFRDSYGEVRFEGRMNAQTFSGVVKFQNTRNINGGTAASGTLGQFYVARCGLIQ